MSNNYRIQSRATYTSRGSRKLPKKARHYRVKNGKFYLFAVIVIIASVGVFGGVRMHNNNVKTKQILSYSAFYDGVVVDDIPIGGMSYAEAQDKLVTAMKEQLKDVSVTITYNPKDNNQAAEEKTWTYDYATLVTGDKAGDYDTVLKDYVDPKLDEAFNQGRQGTTKERLARIDEIKANGWRAGISINYDVLNTLKPELEKIKKEVDVASVDAQMSYSDSTSTFSFTAGKMGWELNTDALFQDIQKKFEDNHTITVNITLTQVSPKFTEEQLKTATSLIGKFSTDYSSSKENRKINVQTALKAFNGKIIWPGEALSFNQTTGERTAANGYKPATVIAGDKSLVDDFGGGVCQVSTTIYIAALRARLDITSRYHHSFPSSYVDKGLDATVNWPTADLKIQNNRTMPVYIKTYFTSSNIYVELYSVPLPDDGKVSIVSEVVKTTPSPGYDTIQDTKGTYATYTDQSYTHVTAREGYTVDVYRVIKDDVGQITSKTKLYTDVYNPIKGQIYVGVKVRSGGSSVAPSSSETPNITPDVTPETTPVPEQTAVGDPQIN